MSRIASFFRTPTLTVVALGCVAAITGSFWSQQVLAQAGPPIATIGHGAFFDEKGRQIRVTRSFVEKSQAWYRAELLSAIDDASKREFADVEKRVLASAPADWQGRLIAQQRLLGWLLVHAPKYQDDDRTLGKLRALDLALEFTLAERADGDFDTYNEAYPAAAALRRKLDEILPMDAGAQLKSATTNTGQAYINECMAARVPIPPTINLMDPSGVAGWKSQGFIPQGEQFIIGSPAEVRTYRSTSPAGMCYALPRFSNASLATVALDGVICLSQETSKVCFWDNQMSGSAFTFPAGTQIPIGVADTSIDPMGRYQAGGFELLGGSGGVCTDCHAGENPYIAHPKADLGGGVLWESLSGPPQNLPTFAPNRYDPLVAAAWPQNQLSQAGPTVPSVCSACHFKGFAGRFPHLSNQLFDYCNTVLPQAITKSMPPPPPAGNPGSAATVANAFKDSYCFAPPDASAADAGDPHLTTTNGIHYDFQSAGEFVALRNSDTGFELQTRQSPVQTTFTPPANAYTGLASCVSLNTAVALRVGKHRVTYQQEIGTKRRMELRIDGSLEGLSGGPIDLGPGNVVAKAGSGNALDIHVADGTRVTVKPLFWSSQGYWYLDIDVSRTPAREGTMGPVLKGEWLPRGPAGANFGPKPAALADRHQVLNRKFANAWRVSKITSLFDYAPGTSTANFTDVDWPAPPGKPCRTSLPSNPPLKEPNPELAKRLCSDIKDDAKRANCVFDVTVMGEAAAAGYLP